MLRHLSQHADVSLACLADEPVSEESHRELHRLCVRVGIVPVEQRLRWVRAGLSLLRGHTISEGAFQSPELTRLLNAWGEQIPFDATLASSSALASYLRLPALQSAQASVDLIDVDSQKWLDYAAASRGPKAWLYRHEGRRMRALEVELTKWVRQLFVVSEAEADIFRSFCPNSPITAISNGVDVDYFRPARGEGREARRRLKQDCITHHSPLTTHHSPLTTLHSILRLCRSTRLQTEHRRGNLVLSPCLAPDSRTKTARSDPSRRS